MAALRSQNAEARIRRESRSSSDLQGQRKFPDGAVTWSSPQVGSSAVARQKAYEGHQHRRESGSEDYPVSTPQAVLQRTTFPSREVAIFLFEIYFSRIYNSSLLFHKEKFLLEYTAGSVPDFVALSIFALASM